MRSQSWKSTTSTVTLFNLSSWRGWKGNRDQIKRVMEHLMSDIHELWKELDREKLKALKPSEEFKLGDNVLINDIFRLSTDMI